MASLPITKAIILSNRTQVRTSLREELKRCSIAASDILNVRNREEYRDAVESSGDVFFLVLDWEIGPDVVLDILEKNQCEYKVETRPTFLFAAKLDEKVVAVAAEYHVNKVHTGEITGEKIRAEVVQLVKEAKDLSAMRQLLIQVATKRGSNDWDGATLILSQLHNKFPDNTRVMVELAENHLETDNWQDAEVFLTMAVKTDPNYARARHLLARCFLKRGDADEAIECLKDAQLISPYNVNRLAEMGNLFLDLARPHDAKKTFEKILHIAPESKVATSGKASSMLVLGEVNEALGILREAASARELAAVFNMTAILAIKKGNYQAGMNLYKIAIDALGDRPKVLARLMYNMGIGYFKWEKPEDSIQCFQQATKLDPSFADAAHNALTMKNSAAAKLDTAKKASSAARAGSNPGSEGDFDLDKVVLSDQITLTTIGSANEPGAPEATFATDLDGVFDEDDF